jgi:phosphoesterase RecJ-like protein
LWRTKAVDNNDTSEYSVPGKLLDAVTSAETIAVIGHRDPDGDCIGSQVAMGTALRTLGKRVSLVNSGPFGTFYLNKKKRDFVKEPPADCDLYVVLDTPSLQRIGTNPEMIDPAKTIVIDHHVTNDRFGFCNWVEETLISTAEMVYLVINEIDESLLTSEISQELLNAICADNGYFQHIRKHKSFSLLVSYQLIQKGADPLLSYNILYGNKQLNNAFFLAECINRIQSIGQGRVLWSWMSYKDKRTFGPIPFDSASIFSQMLQVKGVEMAVLFKEYKNKRIDMSFRSRKEADVSKVAAHFGGGGHVLAAGASLQGSMTKVQNQVLEYIRSLYSKSE